MGLAWAAAGTMPKAPLLVLLMQHAAKSCSVRELDLPSSEHRTSKDKDVLARDGVFGL